MKTSFIISLLLSLSLFVSAQLNDCAFYLNGKEFSSLSNATKDDLLNFCSFEVKDTRVNKMMKPVSYEWVLSYGGGKILKGDSHSCAKLIETINEMKNGDVIFIDKIKYKGITGLCNGQFAFKFE